MKSKEENVAGIILAAGEGSRAGGNKALLRIDGPTFLEVITTNLHECGCDPVVVVLGADVDNVRKSSGNLDVDFAVNQDWAKGQFTSLKTGLRSIAAESLGVMVTLVDHPLVKKETYALLMEKFLDYPDMIVLPMHGIRHGHPVVIPNNLMEEIKTSPDDLNLKDIIIKHSDIIFEQLVDDAGILQDIDTEDDLKWIREK